MSKQVFLVYGESRSPSDRPVQFLIEAESHRAAWKQAREVARIGRGAFLRQPQSGELEAYPLKAGELTVKRVLSTDSRRRGRPPKITISDLELLAEQEGVKLPPRVRRAIQALEQAA